MTITTTAPHGRTLEALSRIATLLREHRDEIPPVFLSIDTAGSVRVQVAATHTFNEPTRRAAVDFLARTLHLDPPDVDGVDHYRTSNELWHVFTPVHTRKCPTCQKPVVR